MRHDEFSVDAVHKLASQLNRFISEEVERQMKAFIDLKPESLQAVVCRQDARIKELEAQVGEAKQFAQAINDTHSWGDRIWHKANKYLARWHGKDGGGSMKYRKKPVVIEAMP